MIVISLLWNFLLCLTGMCLLAAPVFIIAFAVKGLSKLYWRIRQ